MVLRILLALLIPALGFSQSPPSSYLNLKKNIKILELEGTKNLTQEKVNSLQENLSDVEDLDIDDFDELEDRFNKVINSWLQKRLTGGWNIFLNITTWTYSNDLPIFNQEVLSDETGACAGAGYDWQNHWYGFGVDLCLGGMKGKSAIILPAKIHLKLNLPVFMMASRPKLFWRPGEHTRLVLYVPLIYRYGFSTDPKYSRQIQGGDFSIGFFLGGEWEISNIVLGTSIGKIIGYESTSWNFTIGYRF